MSAYAPHEYRSQLVNWVEWYMPTRDDKTFRPRTIHRLQLNMLDASHWHDFLRTVLKPHRPVLPLYGTKATQCVTSLAIIPKLKYRVLRFVVDMLYSLLYNKSATNPQQVEIMDFGSYQRRMVGYRRRGGLQFCLSQNSWNAWCPLITPDFCHPSWLPPGAVRAPSASLPRYASGSYAVQLANILWRWCQPPSLAVRVS